MIMTREAPPRKTIANGAEELRDSIVQRLKAHDAAVRSTLSDETPKKTTPTKDQ